ncbi:hypothetical protein HAZT_HAZT001417 [Hyalella azteca]|uniref:Ribosomal RNA-processing protein 8 n=1 Tax=Hyalella azteca TaxID=294128 RepID=A0A6A0HAA6_HYAAZ|nr:hypothetical protein HAZT_HAZT001417 [Hyalella azteca]
MDIINQIQQKKKKKKVAHNDGSSIQSPTAAIELACKKLGSSADNQNPAKRNSNVKKRKFPADSTPKETQEAVKILANSNAKKQKEIKKPTAPKKTRLKREEESDGWEDLDSDVDWEAIDTDDCEVIDCSNEEEPELDENFHSDLKSLLSELNFDAVKKQMEKERLDESDTGFETDDTEEENSSESDHDSQQPSDDDLSDSMRGDESRSAHSVNLVVDGEHKAPVNEESKLIKPIKHVKAADVHKIGASLAKFGKCPAGELPSKLSKSQSLAQKMQLKLNVAKFRMINEQLYKISGEEAQELFKDDPESFKIYHDGFQSQVALWPLKPLDIIIDWLKIQDSSWVVADFGCGEGELAERVQQKVHSLDLVAIKPHVPCDMAHTPLRPQSVNVAVFCLSLMGTNVSDFIKEANRTLKPGGILKIAEVESRITNVEEFVAKIQKFGFKCCKKPVNHNYFVSFDFKKVKDVKNRENLPVIKLKPCLYKKR